MVYDTYRLIEHDDPSDEKPCMCVNNEYTLHIYLVITMLPTSVIEMDMPVFQVIKYLLNTMSDLHRCLAGVYDVEIWQVQH